MTDEPDIVRQELPRRGKKQWEPEELEARLIRAFPSSWHPSWENANTVRVAADEQRDYGDEHKERA